MILVLFLLIVVGLAILPYVLRYYVGKGVDKIEDTIKNKRADKERTDGNKKVENLSDRYK